MSLWVHGQARKPALALGSNAVSSQRDAARLKAVCSQRCAGLYGSCHLSERRADSEDGFRCVVCWRELWQRLMDINSSL